MAGYIWIPDWGSGRSVYREAKAIRLTRPLLRTIKRMSLEELDTWLKAFSEEAYNEGYAEGLTADLDGEEFIVMDENEARKRVPEEALKKLMEDKG